MAEANALTIAALPADGHGWRIDWFGEIAFPNRMIRPKQPSVLLHLSRVIDERYHEDHSVLLNPESTFVAKQCKVWVSVGTLPIQRFTDLTTKTIWKNQILTVPPSGAVFFAGPTSETNAAVGDVGSDRRVRSVDLQIKKNESELPIPNFLKEIVDDLKAMKEWKLELLTESSEDGWTIPMSILADEEGEIDLYFS